MNIHQLLLPKRETSKEEIMHIFPDVRTQRFSLGFVLALLMAATFLTSPMMAQRLDSTLRGDVKDQTGAMVPEAKVTATNEATNVPQTTVSTSSGSYIFPNLLPGTYTVTVEAKHSQRYQNKLKIPDALDKSTVEGGYFANLQRRCANVMVFRRTPFTWLQKLLPGWPLFGDNRQTIGNGSSHLWLATVIRPED
jgi:hypothetical protein